MQMQGDPTPLVCLASGSPRRHALLAQIGVPHVVCAADIDETVGPGEAPAELIAVKDGAPLLARDPDVRVALDVLKGRARELHVKALPAVERKLAP